jgi:hypothetical protein
MQPEMRSWHQSHRCLTEESWRVQPSTDDSKKYGHVCISFFFRPLPVWAVPPHFHANIGNEFDDLNPNACYQKSHGTTSWFGAPSSQPGRDSSTSHPTGSTSYVHKLSIWGNRKESLSKKESMDDRKG